ncbi:MULTISPECIES: VOC family protein [unclassified Halomonas]|uniref:VOC family protein n=1 Tax=unclassified Halomonas TaxID=2609666 RepID=UPI00299E3284|nr:MULTISPECIES: VOC family protein [unclassified Halomonas]
MKPRISVITLGVDDLEKAIEFYQVGLGLKTDGIIGTEFEYGAVAFFDLNAGLKLALWPRDSISHDSGLPKGDISPTEFSIGHNVTSKEEVDAVMMQAQVAGANIVKEAHDTFWGGLRRILSRP